MRLCANMPVGSGSEVEEEWSWTPSTRVGIGEAALPRM